MKTADYAPPSPQAQKLRDWIRAEWAAVRTSEGETATYARAMEQLDINDLVKLAMLTFLRGPNTLPQLTP